MKRLVAHALAIAIGACAGIAAAQLNGGVMESQRQGAAAITSGAINDTTIGATTPAVGTFTTLTGTTGGGIGSSLSTTPKWHIKPSAVASATYNADDTLVIEQAGNNNLNVISNATNFGGVLFSSGTTRARGLVNYDHTNDLLWIQSTGTIKMSNRSTGATQLRVGQTTAPTCSASCGTSPAVVGSDVSGIVTMGASGVPASGWVITFNGTWAAAPACVVQSALATMVVGKMPIAVVTTTTTITVTTNGTAPATNDKYQYICVGVS